MGMEMAKTGGGRDEEDVSVLPGFRFHPTDEELLGFYLRRKVEKKSLSIELIKQVDIYKHEPWDLLKGSNVGDKEWYFFCKRGRKYRNSIRPNRVTGSGFWKATGIDRPVYSAAGDCVGLKKSLVYYRGCAGKGTKTDWMMHEFRLPPRDNRNANNRTHPRPTSNIIAQEAEVWTLCRIFKRIVSYKKCIPDWRSESSAKANPTPLPDASPKTCTSTTTMEDSNNCQAYISFQPPTIQQNQNPSLITVNNHVNNSNQLMSFMSDDQHPPLTASHTSSLSPDRDMINQVLKYGDSWDELRSIVEFAIDPFLM